jgi:hypothetical protein
MYTTFLSSAVAKRYIIFLHRPKTPKMCAKERIFTHRGKQLLSERGDSPAFSLSAMYYI